MAGFPDPGDRVGRYRVLREVGRGDLGRVYEATDTVRDTTVSLKVLVPRHRLDRAMRARLAIDLEALAALASPQVVPVSDFDEHEGRIFIVGTWFPHGSLQARLDRQGTLGRAASLALGTHLAKALYDAHAVGVVHGGVKPANVFRGADAGASKLPQLADFGASLRTGEWEDPGGLPNGAAYVAPERRSGGVVDERGDIYALGCLLHAVLTGRPPADDSVDAHRLPVIDEVDAGINAVLDRALAPDPADRFADVAEMGRELTTLASAAVQAAQHRVAPAEESQELPDVVAGPALAAVQDLVGVGSDADADGGGGRRRRTPLLVAGVAAVALVAAGGSWVWGHGDHDNAPSGGAAAAGGQEGGSGAGAPSTTQGPKVPKVSAAAAYRAVEFTLSPAPEGSELEVNLGSGWQVVDSTSVRIPTAVGGQRACLKARTSTDGEQSTVVDTCGTSTPPTLRTVRVRPDCTVAGSPQVCYRLEARGFRSDTDPVLQFIVDNRAAGTAAVHIGRDGTGTLPHGQRFHFADSDAGKTATITLAGQTYRWRVARR
jgi:hypothetical protein